VNPQQTIAHYRITGKLGEGGMGAVYRATDTRLAREVAIKVLPDTFAADPDRLARFRREAQVLASLNHPNIAAIYGVEDRALVLELVEGPTLAERIAQGPIPIEEAVPIARQMAEALEYAHEKGIVHRDLKPANIKITPEGRVKVLDFGLAKAMANDVAAGDPASSPTMTMSATMAGLIMGTASYMAPEQAKGRTVDRRADIWAYGVVLMEMLTGRKLHTGESISETLASVIRDTPNFDSLPADTPPSVRRILKRCLDKDPQRRLRDIGEARIAIDDGEVGAPLPVAVAQHSRVRLWIVAPLLLTIAVLGGSLWRATRPADRPLLRFDTELGPGAVISGLSTFALSPDGSRIVYPVRTPAAKSEMLAIRALSQLQGTVLAGTEGGAQPFFSPDGQWIGFFAQGKLKKISASGGGAISITEGRTPRGAAWGEGDVIVAALSPLDLFRLSANSGSPQLIPKQKEFYTYRWPQILPGGEWALVTAHRSGSDFDEATIGAVSLKTSEFRRVRTGGYYARYVPTGHLLFINQSNIMAVAFDLKTLQTRGPAVAMVDDASPVPEFASGQFDFDAAGKLAYMNSSGLLEARQLSWMDAEGKQTPVLALTGLISAPRISPDGKRVALGVGGDILIYDFERHSSLRLTTTPVLSNRGPVWAPDGKHVAYSDSTGAIWWARADGAIPPERLLASDGGSAGSFSPDGKWLTYHHLGNGSGRDILTLPLDLTDADHPKAGAPVPFVNGPTNEIDPILSPDGKWMAYTSGEVGAPQVYVRPFPARSDGGKWLISNVPSRFPVWSRAKPQLFMETSDGKILVTDYRIEGQAFSPGAPRVWCETPVQSLGIYSNYDVAPDGKRILMTPAAEASANQRPAHAVFLVNFFDELKRRLP
jgi:serine/threonine protein kinase/Tol biopolymer transport system component